MQRIIFAYFRKKRCKYKQVRCTLKKFHTKIFKKKWFLVKFFIKTRFSPWVRIAAKKHEFDSPQVHIGSGIQFAFARRKPTNFQKSEISVNCCFLRENWRISRIIWEIFAVYQYSIRFSNAHWNAPSCGAFLKKRLTSCKFQCFCWHLHRTWRSSCEIYMTRFAWSARFCSCNFAFHPTFPLEVTELGSWVFVAIFDPKKPGRKSAKTFTELWIRLRIFRPYIAPKFGS